MNHARILLRLSWLPFRRSWVVLGLMTISIAQLMLGLWFCGSLQGEIQDTENYAAEARFVTIQMKDTQGSLDAVREVFSGQKASLEEWSTEDVLKKMEQEEPELVQTVRSIGEEGLQLLPRLLVAQGVIGDDVLEKVKLMTDVARVDSSPVHHSRLLHFYHHLGLEIRIAVALLLILVLVQLIVFRRIQARDTSEVMGNLIAWGVPSVRARIPAFFSMMSLSLAAGLVSVCEWFFFRKWIWRYNSFLGELSMDHSLGFPWAMIGFTFVGLILISLVLVFSGRIQEE